MTAPKARKPTIRGLSQEPDDRFEVYYDGVSGMVRSGRSYGMHSLNFRPLHARPLSELQPFVPEPSSEEEERIESLPEWRPSKLEASFEAFLAEHPDTLIGVRRIADSYTFSDPSHADDVESYVLLELTRQWPPRVSWKALARVIARRRAEHLRKQSERAAAVGEEILKQTPADERDDPSRPLIEAEEMQQIKEAIDRLPHIEWAILDAYANAKSQRDAAARLDMPESTFRVKLHAITSKIQPGG